MNGLQEIKKIENKKKTQMVEKKERERIKKSQKSNEQIHRGKMSDNQFTNCCGYETL